MEHRDNFFGALFDFTFSQFVTPRVARVLYILAVILVALVAVGMIIRGFDNSREMGVVTLVIFAPLYFLVTVISIRIVLELIMVIFRIGENTSKLAGTEGLRPLETPCAPPPEPLKSDQPHPSSGS